MKPTGIEAEVCADIAQRQQRGLAKYGVSVAENPLLLADWMQHTYEEVLDTAIYIKRALQELRTQQLRDAEAIRLGREIQRACAELPEGWQVQLDLEQGSGTVSVYDPHLNVVQFEPEDCDGFSYRVTGAIEQAKALAAGEAEQ